jgi:hypothetical protein
MFFVWKKYVPKSYRKHILTWKMQKFNNLHEKSVNFIQILPKFIVETEGSDY